MLLVDNYSFYLINNHAINVELIKPRSVSKSIYFHLGKVQLLGMKALKIFVSEKVLRCLSASGKGTSIKTYL